MTDPAVELDRGVQVDVLDVSVVDASTDLDPALPSGCRKSVGTLDPHEISTLQDGVGTVGRVLQDREQELPSSQVRSLTQGFR